MDLGLGPEGSKGSNYLGCNICCGESNSVESAKMAPAVVGIYCPNLITPLKKDSFYSSTCSSWEGLWLTLLCLPLGRISVSTLVETTIPACRMYPSLVCQDRQHHRTMECGIEWMLSKLMSMIIMQTLKLECLKYFEIIHIFTVLMLIIFWFYSWNDGYHVIHSLDSFWNTRFLGEMRLKGTSRGAVKKLYIKYYFPQ